MNALNHRFSPDPLGNELFSHFGSNLGLPLVGNFDPPVADSASEQATAVAPQNTSTVIAAPAGIVESQTEPTGSVAVNLSFPAPDDEGEGADDDSSGNLIGDNEVSQNQVGKDISASDDNSETAISTDNDELTTDDSGDNTNNESANQKIDGELALDFDLLADAA